MFDRGQRRCSYGLLALAGVFAVWRAVLPFDPTQKFQGRFDLDDVLGWIAMLCIVGALGLIMKGFVRFSPGSRRRDPGHPSIKSTFPRS